MSPSADAVAPNPATAVHYELSGGVATLTMDQPQNRNALTPALLNALGDSLARAEADPAARVIVLTHTPPAFCAGADLSGGGSPTEVARYEFAQILTAIQDGPKPVVARVAGPCMGGGVGLAAACDISVAADDVRLGFTEVRIGVAPAIISVVCLPKLRRADALELFLTGQRIEARRAVEVGLINRAVPGADLDAEIGALVDQLLAGGPAALAAAKRLVFDVPQTPRDEAFRRTTAMSQALFASEEAAEGMAAFREKRPPSWAPNTLDG
jgi:methylglutaconyl-CoA hydratase